MVLHINTMKDISDNVFVEYTNRMNAHSQGVGDHWFMNDKQRLLLKYQTVKDLVKKHFGRVPKNLQEMHRSIAFGSRSHANYESYMKDIAFVYEQSNDLISGTVAAFNGKYHLNTSRNEEWLEHCMQDYPDAFCAKVHRLTALTEPEFSVRRPDAEKLKGGAIKCPSSCKPLPVGAMRLIDGAVYAVGTTLAAADGDVVLGRTSEGKALVLRRGEGELEPIELPFCFTASAELFPADKFTLPRDGRLCLDLHVEDGGHEQFFQLGTIQTGDDMDHEGNISKRLFKMGLTSPIFCETTVFNMIDRYTELRVMGCMRRNTKVSSTSTFDHAKYKIVFQNDLELVCVDWLEKLPGTPFERKRLLHNANGTDDEVWDYYVTLPGSKQSKLRTLHESMSRIEEAMDISFNDQKETDSDVIQNIKRYCHRNKLAVEFERKKGFFNESLEFEEGVVPSKKRRR